MASEQLEEVIKFQRATSFVDPLGEYGIDCSLYQHLHAAYVIHDSKTQIVAWNHQALELLGLSANSILGKDVGDPHWRFVNEEGSDLRLEDYPVSRVINTGKPLRHEIIGIIRSKDEPVLWVQVCADPVIDKSRILRFVLVTFMDVTARIEAQKQLTSSEQLYKSVINVMEEGLVIHDLNGDILDCNAAAERILGFPKAQIAGKSLWDPQWQTVNEDGNSFPGELYPASVALKPGMPRKNVVMGVSRPDGDISWVTVNSAPIFEKNSPQPTAAVVTFSDITETRQAINLLQENENLFRGLVSVSPMAMLVVSADALHKIQLMNDRFTELFGYTVKDVPDVEHWWPRAYPEEAYRQKIIEKWNRHREDALRKGLNRIEPVEAKVCCKDGNYRYVEVHMAILADKALVVFNDLTERKQTERNLMQAAAVFENTSEGVMITDSYMSIIATNKAFSVITGFSQDDVVGKTPAVLCSNHDNKDFFTDMWKTVNESGNWRGELLNKRKNGELYPVWITVSEVKDQNSKVTNYVAVFSDITQVKRSEERLYYLAHHDPLTTLPNRLQFISQAEHAIQRAKRNKTSLAIMFVDLDRFKHINDSLGHPVGDKIILRVADRLKIALRDKDTVARLGGDEFTVLIDDVDDVNGLSTIARKLIEKISEPIEMGEHQFCISASVGISVYPQDGSDVNVLISNADAAMYRAKEMGRSSFQYYTRDMTEHALERATIETRLRNAINKGEMSVFLQPRFNITTGKLVGAEALLHWENEEQGLVPADKFIPLAEENGSINPLGEFALQQVCEVANKLRVLRLLDASGKFRLSVNISTFQLIRRNIVSRLSNIINECQCPASMIEFELTESLFAQPDNDMVTVIKKFRDFGISIAVDNFGVGYSSLNNLRKFPLDRLKIDVSFVRKIPDDVNDVAIARAVIALSHSLQLKVVAEGVETQMQHNFLLAEGCNEVQGYLYSRPVCIEEFTRRIGGWV